MFKTLQAATALSLVLTGVAADAHVKSMHGSDSTDMLNKKHMVKEVHGFWGYEYMASTIKDRDPLDEDRDFRFEFGLDADLGLGYEGLIFWIKREGKNLLVLNPNAFLEVASKSWISIKLYFIEFTIKMDLTGYRITPLDYQATWDIDNKRDYCQSVGAVQDLLDMEFLVETRVYECYLGFIGWMVGTSSVKDDDDAGRDLTVYPDATIGDDLKDCQWVRYYPQLPLWSITALPKYDKIWDYYDWTCNYYDDVERDWDAELEWDDDVNGFGEVEPSNIVI